MISKLQKIFGSNEFERLNGPRSKTVLVTTITNLLLLVTHRKCP